MRSTSLVADAQQAAAAELYAALRAGRTVPPFFGRPGLDFDIDDAYAVSLEFLRRRLADGERVVGKKIGVTSSAVMDMLGVDQPDFGFLTDAMQVAEGTAIDIRKNRLIQPRAEAEIAFILRHSLQGPGVTEQDVLAATEWVAPCFEIVDSRIHDWKIRIVDTVADNASCGVFVIGAARVDPRALDLPNVAVTVTRNGSRISEGLGSAVQGSPLTAVAWLANTLGLRGVSLDAGDIILSGSLVPLAPAQAGDVFQMDSQALGRCEIKFV